MQSKDVWSRQMRGLVIGLTVFCALAGAATAEPAIAVTATGFRATGITPGGEVVWFGASIGTFNMSRLLQRHARVVADSDRDGVVTLDMPEVSRFIVLTAVDLTSGAVAVHRGESGEGTELDLRGNRWRAALEHLDIPAEFLELLVVRPGTGAWTLRCAEGGDRDGDGAQNGAFRLKLKDMEPLAGDAKLQGNVGRGDVVVIIDQQSLAYVVQTARD
jgi:hypothetical protein